MHLRSNESSGMVVLRNSFGYQSILVISEHRVPGFEPGSAPGCTLSCLLLVCSPGSAAVYAHVHHMDMMSMDDKVANTFLPYVFCNVVMTLYEIFLCEKYRNLQNCSSH